MHCNDTCKYIYQTNFWYRQAILAIMMIILIWCVYINKVEGQLWLNHRLTHALTVIHNGYNLCRFFSSDCLKPGPRTQIMLREYT